MQKQRTDGHASTEVATKYESPYANGSTPQFDAPVSPLKRRASQDNLIEGDEKRQRIETNSIGGGEVGGEEINFDEIIAQAAASATQAIENQNQNQNQDQDHSSLDNIFRQHMEHQPLEQPLEQISQDYSQHTPQAYTEPAPVVESTPGFSSDPHLYMRILSLPILESLVRGPVTATSQSVCLTL